MATPWRKSARSTTSGNQNCVEARSNSEVLQVRDSKLGSASPIMSMGTGDFDALLRAAQR